MTEPLPTTPQAHLPRREQPEIILASGSPRRRELLASIGCRFRIVLPTVDEKEIDATGLSPREKVLKLAEYKGASVAAIYPDALVIAADTLVAIDQQILEKPEDEADAFRMLSALQGRRHKVYSAIAVFHQRQSRVEALETTVEMRALTPPEIWDYIHTGEPMDKAGSYAIQGHGSVLIRQIEGCYFNVVGMSLFLLAEMCRTLNVSLSVRAQ